MIKIDFNCVRRLTLEFKKLVMQKIICEVYNIIKVEVLSKKKSSISD